MFVSVKNYFAKVPNILSFNILKCRSHTKPSLIPFYYKASFLFMHTYCYSRSVTQNSKIDIVSVSLILFY